MTQEISGSRRKPDWIAVTALVFAILASLFSTFRTYGMDSNALSNRITALETRSMEADKRMERIENKIDRLLERVR